MFSMYLPFLHVYTLNPTSYNNYSILCNDTVTAVAQILFWKVFNFTCIMFYFWFTGGFVCMLTMLYLIILNL